MFTRQQTNFRPAEEFDRTRRSHVQDNSIFFLCSQGTLNGWASTFTPEHAKRMNFQP